MIVVKAETFEVIYDERSYRRNRLGVWEMWINGDYQIVKGLHILELEHEFQKELLRMESGAK